MRCHLTAAAVKPKALAESSLAVNFGQGSVLKNRRKYDYLYSQSPIFSKHSGNVGRFVVFIGQLSSFSYINICLKAPCCSTC